MTYSAVLFFLIGLVLFVWAAWPPKTVDGILRIVALGLASLTVSWGLQTIIAHSGFRWIIH